MFINWVANVYLNFTDMDKQIERYYKVLGIPTNAQVCEVKAAFRKLAKEFHLTRIVMRVQVTASKALIMLMCVF